MLLCYRLRVTPALSGTQPPKAMFAVHTHTLYARTGITKRTLEMQHVRLHLAVSFRHTMRSLPPSHPSRTRHDEEIELTQSSSEPSSPYPPRSPELAAQQPNSPPQVTHAVAVSAVSGLLFGYDLCIITGVRMLGGSAAPPLTARWRRSGPGLAGGALWLEHCSAGAGASFRALLARDPASSLPLLARVQVVSSVFIGAVIGSLLGGPFADRYGRRVATLLASALFCVGALLLALATSFGTLIVGRMVLGVAVGVAGMSVVRARTPAARTPVITMPALRVQSVYVAEISPASARGSLVVVNEVMICTGCLLALVSDSFLGGVHAGWRWMFGISAVPALAQMLGARLCRMATFIRLT